MHGWRTHSFRRRKGRRFNAVSHPFLFLLWQSFLNRTKARLKRLKQPKYLLGALFVFIYLYAYFFRFLFAPGRPGEHMIGSADSLIRGAGAVILFFLVLSAWIFPHRRSALIFTEAEIAFLFPAPVRRRSLIHYKLLKSQLAILATVLLLTLLTGKLFTRSDAWMRVLGWWFILSTLNLHFLGASFVRTRLLDWGISNWTRRIIVLLLLAGLVSAAVVLVDQSSFPPPAMAAGDWPAWRDYLMSVLQAPPLRYLLAPFYVMLAPYLADTGSEFLGAFGLGLLVLGVHYVWVVRSNVAFEEASVELSRKLADRMAAARQSGRLEVKPRKMIRAPFRLRPQGFASIAFLWKNLISAKAVFRARPAILIAIPIVLVAVFNSGTDSRGSTLLATAFFLTVMLFVWALFLGPQFVRCDFRQDLGAMELLKTYPLPGWQVALGELLGPVAILTAVQFLLLLVLAVLVATSKAAALQEFRVSWIVAAAIMAPFWNALVLLIPNSAVLLFPGWFQTRIDAPQGIEVMGQRLLLFLGQMVVVGVSLLPAIFAFFLGFVLLRHFAHGIMAPIAGALGGSIVLLGESALGVWLMGKMFERFDLAGEQGT